MLVSHFLWFKSDYAFSVYIWFQPDIIVNESYCRDKILQYNHMKQSREASGIVQYKGVIARVQKIRRQVLLRSSYFIEVREGFLRGKTSTIHHEVTHN